MIIEAGVERSDGVVRDGGYQPEDKLAGAGEWFRELWRLNEGKRTSVAVETRIIKRIFFSIGCWNVQGRTGGIEDYAGIITGRGGIGASFRESKELWEGDRFRWNETVKWHELQTYGQFFFYPVAPAG